MLKICPYQPGGFGTSIATALEGKIPLLRSPDGKLDWVFLKAQAPATFIEGSGKVMNTVPPTDFSYFEMINDLVQQEPAEAMDPEIIRRRSNSSSLGDSMTVFKLLRTESRP